MAFVRSRSAHGAWVPARDDLGRRCRWMGVCRVGPGHNILFSHLDRFQAEGIASAHEFVGEIGDAAAHVNLKPV